MTQALDTAAAAFQQALRDLGLSEAEDELGDSATFGRRAALLAAADLLWRRHLGRLLDTSEVQQLLGGCTRQAVSDLVKRRRLLALPSGDGRLAFPAFQFSSTGRPYPEVHHVLELFADVAVDPHTIASWFVTPKELLEGKTPAEWLRAGEPPELVQEAARRTAARLGQ